MDNNNPIQDYQALVERCWNDQSFKKKLIDNPIQTLKEEGYSLPEGMIIKVHENTPTEIGMTIPSRPSDLDDAQLENVAGGVGGLLRLSITSATRLSGIAPTVSSSASSGLSAGKAAGIFAGSLVVNGGATLGLLKALGE